MGSRGTREIWEFLNMMEQLSKLISKKQIVVIATGYAILEAQDFDRVLVLAGVAVVYMFLDATKQIILELARKK